MLAKNNPHVLQGSGNNQPGIDINTAPIEELVRSPRIGYALARRILANRPFRSWSDVERLRGFGPQLVADLKAGGVRL